jgi:cytosine/adenosine deaminase-related metal-dependent hydrolase
MRILSADWLLPISSPPLRDGAVVVDYGGTIVDVGPRREIVARHANLPCDSEPNSILMPGLVNAHTHLELCAMKGVIADVEHFGDWAYQAITKRKQFTPGQVVEACRQGIRETEACGVVAVGDIANHSATSLPLLRASSLRAVVFNELTGFPSSMADSRFAEFSTRIGRESDGRIMETLCPHAPYSVSPELFRRIARYCAERRLVTSIHLAESKDEIEFLRTGKGRFRELLLKLDRWDESWEVPQTSPVGYLDRLGFLDQHVLVVHGVHVDGDDLGILKKRRVSVCTCPRSNARIDTGGVAPVPAILAAGLNVCIGTDSLASNDDLDLWNEMRFLRKLHPRLSEATVLQMATLNGARALGFGEEIGSVDKGKKAALIRIIHGSPTTDPEALVLSSLPRRVVRTPDDC